MKLQRFSWMAAILALAASAMPAFAATLKAGDPAPKLQVSKWVQGDPVTDFEKGKAYIVEFWATWCGPCRQTIPHLNAVAQKFKDKGLVVIGQDVWEKDQSKVAPFVKQMGTNMTYRVALDTVSGEDPSEGKMAQTWMKAADRDGIPSAFLIDKNGNIAWIGHPMELEESTIQQVLDGTFDIKKAAADQEKAQQNEEQISKLARQLRSNIQAKEWDKAESTLNDIEKLLPEDKKAGLSLARLKILLGKGDSKAASQLATDISNKDKDNADLLNALAWMIATEQGIKDRDLPLAEKLATRANEITKGSEPQVLDTLARIEFMLDKKDKAIELQTTALKNADEQMKPHLQETLDSYKQGKLPGAE